MKTTSIRHQLVRGALTGVVGTVAMTIPILVCQRLHLFHTPPPVEISANIARRTWLLPDRSHRAFPIVWIGAHLGYGAMCGVVYSLIRRFLPESGSLAGLVFGLAVWAVSYLGYVPALRLYPWPADDSRPRQVVMLAAHGILGLTIAGAHRRLIPRTR
jgi:uncharacterized membrane protein YagU involved in acid resistance